MEPAEGAVAESRGVRPLGLFRAPGPAGGMQLMVYRGHLYLGRLGPGAGVDVFDVRDPARPRWLGSVAAQAGAYTAKVQTADDLLLVSYEQRDEPASRTGLGVFDLSDPARPRPLGFLETGGRGVHRMWYAGGRYAYVSAVPAGFRERLLLVVDLADPRRPEAVGRWAVEEAPAAAGPEGRGAPLRYNVHHAVVAGERAYAGCWDLGAVILDVSDPRRPREVARMTGWAPEDGGHTHTALPLPGRKLAAVSDEATAEDGRETPKTVRLFDLRDERRPRLLARIPPPAGRYAGRGGRFGAHNLHENRPGAFRSETLLFATFFSAGLRVYDISRPSQPVEAACFLPEPPPGQPVAQVNDLFVDEGGLVYLSDRRHGGIWLVELS